MAVPEPVQQSGDIATIRTRKVPGVIGIKRIGQPDQRRIERRRVGGDLPGIGQHRRQQGRRFPHRGGIGSGSEPDVDPHLVGAVDERLRIGGRCQCRQLTVGSPAGPQHRIHHPDIGDAESVQQHRHRIHQHRAVVGDHLYRGPEAAGVIA
jgi:hypothetical protein